MRSGASSTTATAAPSMSTSSACVKSWKASAIGGASRPFGASAISSRSRNKNTKTSQKTLMGKYYSVCCAIILLSMVLVGSIFMVLANDYLGGKISLLEKNVTQAARLTMENYAAHEYRYVSSTLQPVYAVLRLRHRGRHLPFR